MIHLFSILRSAFCVAILYTIVLPSHAKTISFGATDQSTADIKVAWDGTGGTSGITHNTAPNGTVVVTADGITFTLSVAATGTGNHNLSLQGSLPASQDLAVFGNTGTNNSDTKIGGDETVTFTLTATGAPLASLSLKTIKLSAFTANKNDAIEYSDGTSSGVHIAGAKNLSYTGSGTSNMLTAGLSPLDTNNISSWQVTLKSVASGANPQDAFRIEHLVIEYTTQSTGSGPFIVTDRNNNDVSAQTATLIDSDHIHIHSTATPSPTLTYQYKYLVQANAPTTAKWNTTPELPFYQDLWFYRKNKNQWIKVTTSDGGSAIYALKKGTLTAPPDDPILPNAYVAGMGPGLIVEADSYRNVDPEHDVVTIKKAGFGHIRMHIGRLLTNHTTPNTPDNNPNYFDNLDRWIEQATRHGLHCHIGNKGESVWQTTSNLPEKDPAWSAGYHAEMLDWWTTVADRYKYRSHLLAYHMFLETGGVNFLKKSSLLNPLYSDITEAIRPFDPARLLIYSPPSLNNAEKLVEMDFPYPDQHPNDGVTTGSGDYWFSDFHRGFASGRLWRKQSDKDETDAILQVAIDWIATHNKPLILSACRPTRSNSNHDEYIANRVKFINHLYSKLDQAAIPIPVTWLSYANYNLLNNQEWIPGKRVLLEAMNRSGTAQFDDADGDLISDSDEINLYNTDPNNPDTDGDNILDTYEVTIASLDPNDPSDGDPYSDLGLDADFDGDGMGNAWELLHAVEWGENPLTAVHQFNINDPADADIDLTTDNDTVINIWERALMINPHGHKSLKGGNDDTGDFDSDGTSNAYEMDHGSWPAAASTFDRDYDNISGDTDPLPFINNQDYIVGYTFTAGSLADQSTSGSSNNGALLGDATPYNGTLHFPGKNGRLNIPKSDFSATTSRSIHLHFWPKSRSITPSQSGYQILYKEGNTNSGISIHLYNNQLWAGIWNGADEQFLSLGTVTFGQWHSVTLAYNATENRLSAYAYQGNSRISVVKTTTNIATVGDATAPKPSLAGSAQDTRVWNPSTSGTIQRSGMYFRGFIDDTHIFSRELSESEAGLLARSDLSPLKDPTISDSDGDGTSDLADDFPLDASKSSDIDTDNDGFINYLDFDDDNDGASDKDEAIAGTDPLNRNSLLKITSIHENAGAITLSWSSVSGKTYILQSSTDLINWEDVAGVAPVTATGAVTTLSNIGISDPKTFFRIMIKVNAN